MTSTPAYASTYRNQLPASSASTAQFVQPPSPLGAGNRDTSLFTMRPSSGQACHQASANGWLVRPKAWLTVGASPCV
eukprot:6664703-Heterocapsa_arctica.AAC.1